MKEKEVKPKKGNVYMDFVQWGKTLGWSEAKQMNSMMNDAKLRAVVDFLFAAVILVIKSIPVVS